MSRFNRPPSATEGAEGALPGRRLTTIALLASLSLTGCESQHPIAPPKPAPTTCAPGLVEAGPSTNSECVTPGLRINIDALDVRPEKGRFEAIFEVHDVQPGRTQIVVFEKVSPNTYKWNETFPYQITGDMTQTPLNGNYTKGPDGKPAYPEILVGMATKEAAEHIEEDITQGDTLRLLSHEDLNRYGVITDRTFGDLSLQDK